MTDTSSQFDQHIERCKTLFKKKTFDYGTAWRILRLSSLTDQIFIKAQRIRGLQTNAQSKIAEGEEEEFMGIVNYAVIALIQVDLGPAEQPDLSTEQALNTTSAKWPNVKP